jgi:uncharacterized glyoxalase superfamily protein PhnB
MNSNASSAGTRLLPVMRYRDVAGAIAWLGRAFGFQEHHVVRCDDGSILYAVLTFANALIMLGSIRSTGFDGLMKQPDEIGGAETQSCYFIVDDAVAHCAAAKAAGAVIVLDIKEYDYGGQGYSCRDPEGHIWSFGTYDPCGAAATRDRVHRRNLLVAAALVVTIGVGGWLAVAGQFGSLTETRNGIAEVLAGRQAAATAESEALRRIGQELIEERHSREAVERALVLERSAKVAAERAAEAARNRLAEWQKTRGSDSQEQSSLPVPLKQMQVPKPRPARKATPGAAVPLVPAPAP